MEERKRSSIKTKTGEGDKENCWLYQEGKEKVICLETPPEDYFGFVYKITNTINGKIYIGKKQFTFKVKTKLSKRARKNTRKRVQVKTIDSKWINYWGSSKELLEDIKKLGKSNFKREILAFGKNKAHLSYLEVYFQIHENVMLNPSYNNWISCKVFKNQILKK